MKNILFLHHSTGHSIWVGKTNKYIFKLTGRGDVVKHFDKYNKQNGKSYDISDLVFPKAEPYGWNNYPYDYYNIWVKNAGVKPYKGEPTLEILTREYDVIIFKHCFPVSRIKEDTGIPDIDSPEKRIENYKLHYKALKQKMHEFPDNRFIVWTPAVCTQNKMSEDEAIRTYQFYKWVTEEWDEKGDNIFFWDFYKYETKGGLFLSPENATSPDNCHPNKEFSGKMAAEFSKFVLNIIDQD